ncbi:MAG: hypothetical protein ABIG61_17770 [Planctomycetota bacterium]
MSDYTNTGIYILLKSGDKFPVGVAPPELGEGRNTGKLDDGRCWFKNCFLSPEEMRAIVHAEDAGLLELKSAEEIRVLMPNSREAIQ